MGHISRNSIIVKLKEENRMLKNTELVKELIHNLKEIRKGKFITRDKLGF